jgi:16S rRNA (cytosine967-C5)-methyltransferase
MITNPGGVGMVNAILRSIAEQVDVISGEIETAKFDVRYSLSKEISGLLIKWFGRPKAEAIAASFLEKPETTARVNTLRCDAPSLREKLESEGAGVEAGRFAPQALRIRLGSKSIEELDAFREGLFMIQDEAAMMASIIADPHPKERILDMCSAPGGKSCHLAELSGNKAEIVSLDVHEGRLALVQQNADRLGLSSISIDVADAVTLNQEHPEWIETFDIVLVDVPCSGLGLLRRKPDIRLTANFERIMSLLPLQAEILQKTALFVRPGGALVYCTCTINPDENDGQVDMFLASDNRFVSEGFASQLPQKLTEVNQRHFASAEKGRLLLLPDEDGCDGFFIAKMRRKQ